jgi:VanZ family protein
MPRASKLALGLTALIATAIAALTLTPVSAPSPIAHSDKIYHVVAFAALALPASFFQPRWLPFALPFFVIFAGLIEIVQPFVGRTGSFFDAAADIAGIFLGVVIGRWLARQLGPHPMGRPILAGGKDTRR